MDLKELKKKGRSLKPFMTVGKNGITENTITQIQLYLKANKLGKVKLTSTIAETAEEKKAISEDLASKANAKLIDRVGGSIILWKR